MVAQTYQRQTALDIQVFNVSHTLCCLWQSFMRHHKSCAEMYMIEFLRYSYSNTAVNVQFTRKVKMYLDEHVENV